MPDSVYRNVNIAELGGFIDLGKALRNLIDGGGSVGPAPTDGVSPATAAQIRTGIGTDRYLSPSAFFEANQSVTLIDQATVTPDFNTGINFLLTLGGNRTIANPVNVKLGQSGVLVIQQDGLGGRTTTWGSYWKFPFTGEVVPQAGNAWVLIHYFVEGISTIRCFVAGSGSSSLNAATVEEVRLGLESLKFISPAAYAEHLQPVSIPDNPILSIDLGLGRNFTITLGGDRFIDSPLDQRPGRSGEIIIHQDNVGGRTLSWHADWKFIEGIPELPFAPGAWVSIRYFVESVGDIRCTRHVRSATVTEFRSGTLADRYVSPAVAFAASAPVDLIDTDIIGLDFNSGNNFSVTLGGNRTMGNPINQKVGQAGIIRIVQDSVGSRTLAWYPNWQFVGGVLPTLPTAPGAWTLVPYYVFSVGSIICTAIDAPIIQGGGSGTTVESATVDEIRQATLDTKYVSPLDYTSASAAVTLTDAATINMDMATGINFVVTLQGNRTLANPTNQKVGRFGVIILKQDNAGGRSISFGNNFLFSGGLAPTLPTAPNDWLAIVYFVESLGAIRCVTSGSGSLIGGAATATEYRQADLDTRYISPKIAVDGAQAVTLTDGATITIDAQSGYNFIVTISGNRTIANPTNQKAGRSGLIIIQQDASGGRTVTWGNNFFFTDGTPNLFSGANQRTIIPYFILSAGVIICASQALTAGSGSIETASVPEFVAGINATKALVSSVFYGGFEHVTLTDGATISWDMATGINFNVTLGGNRAFANPTNVVAGKRGVLLIIQDATGGRTLTWGANYKFPYGNPILPTAGNAWTIINYYCYSATDIRCWRIDDQKVYPETLATLTDTNIVTPANNQIIRYNSTSGKWENTTSSDVSVAWGAITGTLASQTDLATALSGKSDSTHNHDAAYAALTHNHDATYAPLASVRTAASQSETRVATDNAKYITPSVLATSQELVTLTDGPTVTVDMQAGINFALTLGGNRTIATPTNQVLGRVGYFIIKQDGTGGRTLTWSGDYKFAYGAPTIPVAPNAWLKVSYVVEASNTIRCAYDVAASVGGGSTSASAAEFRVGTESAKYLVPSIFIAAKGFVPLTDAPTIDVDMATGFCFSVTIQGNRAIGNPTNQLAGKSGVILIRQGTTPSWSVTWGNHYIFPGQTPIVPKVSGGWVAVSYYIEAVGTIMCGATHDGTYATLSKETTNTLTTGVKFWKGTQANYDAIVTKDPDTLYLVT